MYYIKQVILYSGENTVSTVELSPDLNIIYGESNTGKTLVADSIDYLFGAKKHRFAAKLKIKKVALVLDVDGKQVTMSREIDSTKINVSSTADVIDSDEYNIGKGKKSINSVWLKLMGIDSDVKILMTITGKTQHLTLRTFSHTLLLDETRIQGYSSILVQGLGPNRRVDTNVLTSYLYLATGKNYLPDKLTQDPKIRKAKQDAVKAFVDRSMTALANKKVSELANFSNETPEQLQKKIDGVIDEIGAAEGALEDATTKTQALADRIYEIDNQISESRMLINRNKSLMTQYESDIRRLTFIAEGDIQHGKIQRLQVCPFCNGQLTKDQGESCIDAAVAEVDKIEAQINDLRSVQQSIAKEIEELNKERVVIIDQRRQIDATIRGELKPQIAQLRMHLSDYKLALNQYKAKEMIESFSDVLVEELNETVSEEGTDFDFDVKAKFKEVFQSALEKELDDILKKCHYEDFNKARFDMDDYDVVADGSPKATEGQGYRAFLNSCVAIAFQNCLEQFDHYIPHLLVLDSPILSLKEKEDDQGESGPVSETIKAGLFRYLVDHAFKRQTIVIENRIPTIDYKDTKLIHFTKDKNNGRYGLIIDYFGK